MISMTTRCIAAMAIIIAGACTTAMNWRFSYQLGTTEFDSITWAIFSVALDVSKWLMLPIAAVAWRAHKLRAVAAIVIWIVATIYSLVAAIGFSALNRDTIIAERSAQAELKSTLLLMRQSPRWQSSAACADATAPASKDFCARYAEAEARLKSFSQDADPQAELIARITGLAIERVRIVLAVFLAIACEVISALGFFAIMAPAGEALTSPKTSTPRWKPPRWRPPSTTTKASGSNGATSRRDAT